MPFTTLAPYLSQLRDAVVIECGAYDGATAEQLQKLLPGPPKRWIAFECDPANLERCRRAAVYRAPGTELLPCAVGDHDGKVTLHRSSADDRAWTASSSIMGPSSEMRKQFEWLRYRGQDRVEVPMRSLDSVAAERAIEHVDLLWCDVEGAEKLIIEGGRKTLERTRYLFLEVWEARLFEGMWTYAEILKALPDFEVVHRFSGDVFMRRRS